MGARNRPDGVGGGRRSDGDPVLGGRARAATDGATSPPGRALPNHHDGEGHDMTHADLNPLADAAPHPVDHGAALPGPRARPRHGPISTWTRSAVRDAAYCTVAFAWSIVAFTILVTGVAV